MGGMADAADAIDRHCMPNAGGTEREGNSTSVRDVPEWIWAQWTRTWINEAFCDLFALFAAGPAYAYSNLHLVSKADADIYRLIFSRGRITLPTMPGCASSTPECACSGTRTKRSMWRKSGTQ